MPNLSWEQTQFRGIHTQPAKTADGHLYAEDTENLRIDGEGWLQLRSDVIAMDPDGGKITGVATTLRHVFTLREDGRLYVREVDTLASEIEIAGVANLSGRISLVNFNTYVILTSEGADQGYIIDMRVGDGQYTAYQLGFDAPPRTSIAATAVSVIPDGVEDRLQSSIPVFFIQKEGLDEATLQFIYSRLLQALENTQLQADAYYHYLYTFVSLDDTEDPWYGMESNPVENTITEDVENATSIDDIKNIRGIVLTTEDKRIGRVTISYARPEPANYIRIYRSNAIETSFLTSTSLSEAKRLDLAKGLFSSLQYRKVADIEISQTSGSFSYYDKLNDDTWSDGELLQTTNDRMPREVKQISEYNDLIFGAAGDRLIYSDIKNGVIVPWAFPTDNDIRVQGSVNFCGEINEVLLFGSRDGLWRLAGNTEYNFAVGQISNSGPIDGYAWSRITDALAFVGEGGLFITDASQVIRVSETVLDDFFQDKKVVRGAVAFFKDGDILYAVTLEDRDGNTEDIQFKREDGYYVRWNLPFMQSASIIEANKATPVLVADGTGRLKRLDWNSTANEAEDVAWSWTSQFLDEPGTGLANQRKRYSQFQFTGEAENTMTLQVWKDNEVDPAVEKTFKSRPNLIPVRVPINRIARRLRFKLSGTGPVKIQGMQVVVMI